MLCCVGFLKLSDEQDKETYFILWEEKNLEKIILVISSSSSSVVYPRLYDNVVRLRVNKTKLPIASFVFSKEVSFVLIHYA